MTKVCICQICNCGRHRCPHKPQPLANKALQPCTLSEYAQTYHAHPMEQVASFKPSNLPQQTDAPLDDHTTHRVDYVKHPLEKPYVHQGDVYKPPEGAFDPMTMYKKDYFEKQGERAKPIKQQAQRAAPGKFEGKPSYKIDYRRWTPQPRAPIINDAGYRPPTAPFDGIPNYTSDYHAHPLNVRQSMRPMEQNKASDAPFESTTGYRVDYTKHPLPPKIAKTKADWAPNKSALDDLTNYKMDYVAKQAAMTRSCKPDATPYNSGAPIADETTQRVDFKKWPSERPHYHQPDAYQKPDGNMQFDTTTGRDYTKKQGDRVTPRKPAERQANPGKFNDDTTHKNDFRKWPMDRVHPQMKSGYVPNDAPFEGQTTVQRDYVPKHAAVRQSMKPIESSKKSDAPFDGTPLYKQEYVKHPIPEKFERAQIAWKPSGAPLDDLSNYKKDYGPKEIKANPSCKPDATPYNSGAPIADETTQRVDFKKWPSERPHYHQPDAYQKPDGNMQFDTTSGRDFTKKPIHAVTLRKPAAAKRDPGKFQGTTDYTDSYRKWGIADGNRVQFKSDYSPPQAPFQGTTVYDDDFKAKQLAMRSSMRPVENTGKNTAPFDGNTMYRTEYTPKDLPPCPAGVIEGGGAANYVFANQDPTGHKWYEPMVSRSIAHLPTGSQVGSAQKQPVALSVC